MIFVTTARQTGLCMGLVLVPRLPASIIETINP